jgi:hypothetical protein
MGAGAIYGWRNDGTHSVGNNTTRPLSSGGAKGTDRIRTTRARVFQKGTTRAGCRIADPTHKTKLNGEAAACNCQELAAVSRVPIPEVEYQKLKPPFGAAFFFVSEASSALRQRCRPGESPPFARRSTGMWSNLPAPFKELVRRPPSASNRRPRYRSFSGPDGASDQLPVAVAQTSFLMAAPVTRPSIPVGTVAQAIRGIVLTLPLLRLCR